MEQYLETIRIEEGRACHLPYHNQRMNETRAHLGLSDGLDLEAVIGDVSIYQQRTRCRIVYDTEIRSVEFFPYQIRSVKTLRLVEDNQMDYGCKYANRSALNRCFAQRGACDDVLIVQNGDVTDTTIANVAFWNGETWFTPSTPLLKGTMRASLLDSHQIQEAKIRVEDLSHFSRLRLFNAMISFGEIELPIQSVLAV
jgi:4-amino-4-deoxychorismate lyase